MFTLDELKWNKLLKKQFMAPFAKEDKRHGAAILLLSPNYETSKRLMTTPFMIDRMRVFSSYYIERDIMYSINQDNKFLEMTYPDEGQGVFTETTDVSMPLADLNDCEINELYCRLGDKVMFFGEMTDEDIFDDLYDRYQVHEAKVSGINSKYKKLLYHDRLRNNKAVIDLYKQVKADFPWIKRAFPVFSRYHGFNLFVDLYYYNEMYLTNNTFSMLRSIDMYYEFILRILKDKRITEAGYKKLTVFIPVFGWPKTNGELWDYKSNLNPMSVIYKKMRLMPGDLKVLQDINFVFIGQKGYFKFNANNIPNGFQLKFKKFINTLASGVDFQEEDENDIIKDSPEAITASVVDDIERATGAKINNLTGNIPPVMVKTKPDTEEKPLSRRDRMRNAVAKASAEAIRDTQLANDSNGNKAMLVNKIKKAAETSTSKDDAISKLEEDEDVKRIIADLDSESDSGTVTISAARSARITQAQDQFLKKQFQGRSIKEMLSENKSKELPETSIPIATINNEWHHVKAINFEKTYDLDADIVKCINSLSDKNTKAYPIAILNIDKKDTSTSEDSIFTYTVNCEGYDGKRFSFKFDVPKFRDNRFMRLRGNEKIFSIEMPLIPISKTDDNTAQMATFYNKIFIMRYNTSAGKSNPYTNKLLKALDKYKGPDIRLVNGDTYKISKKYELPIDYIDIGRVYSKIIFHSKNLGENVTIFLNQDEIRKIPGINPKNGIPIAMTESGKVTYYTNKAEVPMAMFIANMIDVPKFEELYANQDLLKRCTYSRAKLLNTYIPVIVVLAHDIGLTKAMELAGIEYDISTDKKARRSASALTDVITFKDGFLTYKATYASMMLMNGLKDCTTETIGITDINKKATWIEQLANFGGRHKSDGLDNFKALMYDPVTIEVCKDYNLPMTYHEGLIYASNLLVDNKFTKHTDLASNRYRTNEVVAAQFYRILAQSYREYASFAKRNRKAALMMKQSAVLDLILQQNNTSDLSVFQPLSEIETKNTVSTKGVTGLNEERSYTLEKRGYDPSMENIIAQSTSFAKQVGINRQVTIDPGIVGGRGYFKKSDIKDGGVAQSMGMTESLSPFMLTSDDPYRNNMTFVQTAKHSTPVEDSDPLLVTTGADQAMPYLASNMFAFKAKEDGKVIDIKPEYMLVEYINGKKDYINLSEQTMKNSDGGFYIVLQLITDLKVGDKFRKDTILAWDKKSFSKKVGLKQLSYNVGHLAKIAIMTTEDGFEDSGVCSEWLSEHMASDIVIQKPISLTANTEILQIVKVGQNVREGEPLLIFQNAFDDDDANAILKNLNIEDGDITTIGRTLINSKITGVVTDIKLYRTCDLDAMSESMKALFTAKEAKVKKLKHIAAGTESDTQFDPTDKLDKNGKLKNSETDVLIEIYVKYHDKMSIGDKATNLNANKIVLMDVYGDDVAPYTDFRPNEKIDVVSSASSIDGRMITSPFKNGALNKLMIELQRKCCNIYGKPEMTLHEMHDYFKSQE